ncbi:c-type cytochrome biogenesis protein CcsB [Corynebacterium casei]|uniref:Cytochrome c biogenesis protein n=1 Tax=Corynebacterium casei LMG S-19264 TaxID=1285583 RepID=A0ABN4CEK0_9CORY|nr:c-type cytochrome biogenesis protein CcsB [Corynebacterium casei]AHI19064.1 cytochrome c biogenesis protein [Corynebacterium casei LMG S-19264]MDN5707273.1 c-type cytochrome biogenesis protein CcsB [Corynebacterium casei]MDN5799967.1 c-type cytochrome biogenesis protein CcsB [Corynebacterium casei]MDN5841456.1 c-type cytochrome biogenesis protein CcsB [Corynebacterium casei]MDN5922492.1 c-type cytochrome biogenesis protein CcsB [Corynebacterium casei]
MPVNQNLSNFSDIAFQTAFVVYAVALVLSLIYYGRLNGVIDARRQHSEAKAAASKAKATVAANGSAAGSSDIVEDDASGVDSTSRPIGNGSESDIAAQESKVDRLGGMTQSLLWVALVLHLASIVLRGLAVNRFPLGNLYEYMMMITFGAMLAVMIAMQRKEWRTLWPWLLTPMLALMFYGSTKLYAESAPVVPALQSYWLPVHVTIVSLGGSLGIVSGIASVLHLLRRSQPKGQEKGFFGAMAKPLPSEKKLDQMAYRVAVVTLPTLGLGIVLGAIWAEAAWGRFWGWDPKETVSFATWILYAAYLHARATPSWAKFAPWINIVALATMIFNLFFINMVVSGLHSYAGLN